MNWRKAIILAAALSAGGTLAMVPRALAQSFRTYRCTDGTQFIVAFYAYDTRAYLQIDGRPVTLARRLALSDPGASGILGESNRPARGRRELAVAFGGSRTRGNGIGGG